MNGSKSNEESIITEQEIADVITDLEKCKRYGNISEIEKMITSIREQTPEGVRLVLASRRLSKRD